MDGLTTLCQSFEFFHSQTEQSWEVTQEFESLLTVKSKLTKCLETNILLNLFL